MMQFPEDIRTLMKQVQIHAGILRSRIKGDLYQGVIDEIRDMIEEGTHLQHETLKVLHGKLLTCFSTSAAVKGTTRANDAAISIVISESGHEAYISLAPPRMNGSALTFNRVLFALKDCGVVSGIDVEEVKKAVDSSTLQRDIVLMVKVAKSIAPTRGIPGHYELCVEGLDLDAVATNPARAREMVRRLTRVRKGMLIAEHVPAIQGTYGVTVKGKEIPPEILDEPEHLFSDNILRLENKSIQADDEGIVIKKKERIEIQELFYVKHSMEGHQQKLFFDGVVVVEGNIKGPAEIVANEIIVTGKAERAKLYAKGDIFVFGGIFGKRETVITAGGKVITFSASDCVIEAVDDIIIAHNLYNSDVSTRGKLLISPKAGIIIGGSVKALHGIETKSYGSDFGIFAEAIVGMDQFSEKKRKRLDALLDGLKEKQALLSRNHKKILRVYSDVSHMPFDKQDLFINLEQRLKQLETEIDYFQTETLKEMSKEERVISASIKVRDSLYPPLKAQICDVAREIDAKLQNVMLQYDQNEGILVSNPKINE